MSEAPNSAKQTQEAEAIKPKVTIKTLLFSSGQKFYFSPNDRVILVGPNNSGKSTTLREILDISKIGQKYKGVVVKDVSLFKDGSKDNLRAFLKKYAKIEKDAYYYKEWTLYDINIEFFDNDYLPSDLASGFVKLVKTEDRLKICECQHSIGPSDNPTAPQHILFDNDELLSKINGLFESTFGMEMMFDYRGGKYIPIHVGKNNKEEIIDRVSDKYVNKVRENPLLDEQGDGIKSYVGTLFESIVFARDVILLDEPEAFLHPPQMRRLGGTLASEVKAQLFIATHSSDVLRGFLEGAKGNIRILRFRRENNESYISEAPPEIVRDLWLKPKLRYSNALDGIFHDQAIICEDDSDCRLINALSDFISSQEKSEKLDTAYVPANGKDNISKIAIALRKIGVPTKGVFDIDVMNNVNTLREIIESFGGEWHKFNENFRRVDSSVRNGMKQKTIDEIKGEIVDIISKSQPGELPKSDIIGALKGNSPWSQVKRFGADAIPSGDSQKYFRILVDDLKNIGVYVLEKGEIENYCREVGSHGPRFVTSLLDTIDLSSEHLSDLRKFVSDLNNGPHCKF